MTAKHLTFWIGLAESTTKLVSGVQIMSGRLFSNLSKVDRCLFRKVPLKAFHLWRWMVHFERSWDVRNVKVSLALRVVIGSLSSISKIQEFVKHLVGTSFLYGHIGGSWSRTWTLNESSSFITTLNYLIYEEMERSTLFPILDWIFYEKYSWSNLIVPRTFRQKIGKLWEGTTQNVGSKRKCGPRFHL